MFLELAQNRDVPLKLGWHVLRNRDYVDRTATTEERDAQEAAFFAEGPWAALNPSQLGAAALRFRLSHVLRDRILKQLPEVLQDAENGLQQARKTLSQLGEARSTIQAQRLYLLKTSKRFTMLVRDAVEGAYRDPFFQDVDSTDGYKKRLRAVVRKMLQEFEEEMRQKGAALVFVDGPSDPSNDRCISRDAYLEQVKALMEKSRGRELPGTFNPLIITELFAQQSRPWKGIVARLTERVFDMTKRTIKLVTRFVVDEQTADRLLPLLAQSLDKLKRAMEKKVDELLNPHITGHPITFNISS